MMKKDIFLYELLADDAVQNLVLGHLPAGMISAKQVGTTIDGLVLKTPNDTELARLDYYVAVYGRRPVEVDLMLSDGTQQPAVAFLAGQGGTDLPDDISAAVQTRMAHEIMGYFGRYSAGYVRDRLSGILRRATSYVASAARAPDATHDLSRDVVVHENSRPYGNFFAVEEMELQFRRYDGQLSEVVNRGTVLIGQVTVVLPYDPVLDRVLLIEQFRAPVFMAGDPAPWIWQPVAGLIDPGETAAEAAYREAKEEAGLTLSRLEDIGQVYPSPGSSNEFIHMFVGIADLANTESFGGLAEEQEDIKSRVLSFDALMQAVDNGEFCDMPLLTSSLWLARHRDRLRAMA